MINKILNKGLDLERRAYESVNQIIYDDLKLANFAQMDEYASLNHEYLLELNKCNKIDDNRLKQAFNKVIENQAMEVYDSIVQGPRSEYLDSLLSSNENIRKKTLLERAAFVYARRRNIFTEDQLVEMSSSAVVTNRYEMENGLKDSEVICMMKYRFLNPHNTQMKSSENISELEAKTTSN